MRPRMFLILAAFLVIPNSKSLAQFSLLKIANTNNGGLAAGVAVLGNTVYLANGADGLRIYDVSNPANPVNVYHTNNGQFAYGVTIAGNYAYVAQGTSLGVYDVTDPSNPIFQTNASIGGPNSPIFIVVTNELAYIAAMSEFLIFSVSNPASPVYITGSLTPSNDTVGIAASGSDIYVADALLGLSIYTDTTIKLSTTKLNNNATANAVVVSGSYAYLANGNDSLTVYAVTNPAAPVVVGRTNTGYGWSIAISSNYVYQGQITNVAVIDVSNPSKPVQLAQGGPTGDFVLGITASGDYVFAAARTAGLAIFQLVPELQIAPIGTNVLLSWPVTTKQFALQQSPDVTGTNWTTVTNAVVLQGQQYQVELPVSPGQAFYRLEQE